MVFLLAESSCMLDWDRFNMVAGAGAVLGDILTYDFNDETATDRSGNGHDGSILGAVPVSGRYGTGLEFDSAWPYSLVEVADHKSLFSDTGITIEAWVFRYDAGNHVVYGDWREDETPTSEFMLVLFAEENTTFYSNNCNEEVLVASKASTVPTQKWTHIAVAWEGKWVRFYRDGIATDEVGGDFTPCEKSATDYGVGLVNESFHAMNGIIDELKVSSYAKTIDEIVQSRDYDSASP